MSGVFYLCYALQFIIDCYPLQRFPVIHVCGSEHKIENLTFVIDYQMRLESEESSHWTFSTLGKSLKCLMNKDSLIATNT